MADGKPNRVTAHVFCCDVTIKHKTVLLEFLSISEHTSSKTLLGVDITACKMNIHFPQMTYSVDDEVNQRFPLYAEPESDQTIVNSLNVSLRTEEGEHLTQLEKNKMEDLLRRNNDVFGESTEATTYIEHSIKLTDDNPIAVPPYRLTPQKSEILKKEIEKLLDENVIEECDSAYAAPVVLVPKKNGTYRMCVDYRKLNSVTIPDRYPLPRIDDLLHATKKTIYMSTLDLKAGYYQVSVKKEDRDKTAFITPFGIYRFRRMPFGLRHSPSTF